MKKFFLSLAMMLCYIFAYSQTVENIRVEPEGEKINIYYRIGGSIEGQFYNVNIECSIDGGPRFIPKAVMGDVGKNIPGAKSLYTIIWDVFDDVDEVGNAEFFITVTPMGGTTPQQEQPGPFSTQPQTYPSQQGRQDPSSFQTNYRKRFFNYEYNDWNPYGMRTGTLGNWGYQTYLRAGYDIFEEISYGITFGPTKRIVNLPKYRLHAFAGVGAQYYLAAEFDWELGLSNVIFNRLVIDLGYSYWLGLSLGIGIAF